MDGPAALEEEHLSPPPRLFERLRQIAGYTWDETKKPVHSSYDNWFVNAVNKRKGHADMVIGMFMGARILDRLQMQE
jgi:hypothetical protein